ncbi:MAG: polysaccharide deacetylase family protein [Deltaproteobacteria bacterium]|nr:polysaccharide deacetylase family protein [Deltaproteobacteria bacterium]
MIILSCLLERFSACRPYRLLKCIVVYIFIIAGTGLLLCSCTSTIDVSRIKDDVTRILEKKLYRSEDYVIYKLPDEATPSELAEKFLGDKNKSWVIKEANPGIPFSKGRSIVIPLKDKNKGGIYEDGFQTIPILTYHRFSDKCNSPLCMPANVFEKQMKYLKEKDYHVVTPEELLAFLEYRQGLPRKSVLISMDDGYRSVYSIAYPILKKYGFTATIFIYTSFVGVSGMAVTWDQLKKLKEEGFTIGSHTVFHTDLTKKKEGETENEFLARVKRELFDSKKIIDKKLGQDTFIFAYPFGHYDQPTIRLAREAGYKIAMSVNRGGNPFFANPLSLKRDQVLKRDLSIFKSRLITFNKLSLK